MTHAAQRDAIRSAMAFDCAGAFLAGGAITSICTGAPVNDFDFYFKSRPALAAAIHKAYAEMECTFVTDRALTFRKGSAMYQFIHFAYPGTDQEIFETFDFTICMAALDLDSGEFTCSERFPVDIARRALVYNHRSPFPFNTGLRVLKYLERGYTIHRAELLKILIACGYRGIGSWPELKHEIGGSYAERVTLDTNLPFGLDAAVEALKNPRGERLEIPATASEAVSLILR